MSYMRCSSKGIEHLLQERMKRAAIGNRARAYAACI